MDRLKEIVGRVDAFDDAPHAQKLRLFAWALHLDGKEHLKAADFATCFDLLHLAPPANLHRALDALADQGDLLKSSSGYRLSKGLRDEFDASIGKRPITIAVHQLLVNLPGQIASLSEREYLDEALRCFQAEAWRAAAIMAWNLAFDHLCLKIVQHKLAEFNAEYAKAHPKKPETFSTRADLQELKESEVIRLARAASLTDATQHKCLERSLGIRNDIAHPSGVSFKQPQAEAFILDVVNSIVLAIG